VTPEHIEPPIVIAEGHDVMIYPSVVHVLSDLEPWYPSNADYRAFDAHGRRLELVADPPVVPKRVFWFLWTDNAHTSSLSIRAVEREPSGAAELAGLLREWLRVLEVPLDPGEEPSLDDLLDRAIARGGYG